jgi:hypothetical protein
MTAVAGDQLPVEIQDSETIVRATKTPHHVNKNQTRLRPSAFRPPPGETTISVMRQLMGDDFCKNKGVEICGEEYIGLATITAIEIRCRGSLVLDHRVDFRGHAHIDHQLPPIPRDEPPPPDLLQQYDDRCKKLAAAAVFHKDPSPKVAGWAGEPLLLTSRLPDPTPAAPQADPSAQA